MKCEIIRDLLPSYLDELTSAESNQAIEEHLQECKDCRKHLEAMKTEMVSERYVKKTAEEIQEEIYPFKKLKKKTVRSIIKTVFICMIIFSIIATAYESYVGTGVTADFEDMKITSLNEDGVVTISFEPKDNGDYVRIGRTADGDWKTVEIVKWNVNPFYKEIERGDYLTITFLDENTIVAPDGQVEKLTGDETLEITCADSKKEKLSVKEVNIKDLYTETGIKELL